jgi:hypothetical protein
MNRLVDDGKLLAQGEDLRRQRICPVPSLYQSTTEYSPGLPDDRFKLRPQRRIDLETLIEIALRIRLAPLLQIAEAAIE